jgi:SAM-dependent methyltransferase
MPIIADRSKAASHGEPSYVWRAGQERRLNMILAAAGERRSGRWLENGCGVGIYVRKLKEHSRRVTGLEYDFERAGLAVQSWPAIVNAAGESLPFADDCFDMILSHEVIEHVDDDRQALVEMVRVLAAGGRIALFCPNRGYPFETHGIYWRGRYRFGNIPLVNYLPRPLRNRLAPHVRVYTRKDLRNLMEGLPLRVVSHTVIFGAYDNIIQKTPRLGRLLRTVLQALEKTPLKILGLSQFWILEKTGLYATRKS